MNQVQAAILIQTIVRQKILARKIVLRRFFLIWRRIYDPRYRIYFWYNLLNKQTQWNRPFERLTTDFSSDDIIAVRLMQRVVRGFIGKMRARKVACERHSRYFDPDTDRFYWVDNKTQVSFFFSSLNSCDL